MGNGLAALMGVLKGTEGLPEGMIAADKQRLSEEALAESKRHAAVLEGQLNTPIGSLYDTLGLSTPEGVDATKTVPTSLAGHAMGALEKEQARKDLATRNAGLDRSLASLENEFGTKTPAVERPEAAMYSERESDTASPATVTPHPSVHLLRTIFPYVDPDKFSGTVTEVAKELASPGGKVTPHQALGNGDTFVYGTNQSGDIVKPPKALGIGAPESRNADLQSIRAGMVAEGWDQGKPTFDIELRRRFAASRPVMAPPGAELINRDSLSGTGAPGQVKPIEPPAGTQPGSMYRNPPPMSEATRERWAAGLYAVKSMNQLADAVEQLGPDTKARMSLFWRAAAQGTPGLNVFQFVSPTEQAEITKLRHVQIRYEQMMGGIRGAGSPYMMEIYREMMGNPAAGQEPTVLRQLSNSINEYMGHFEATERSQGATRPLPQPSPPSAVVAPQTGAPWTDLGNGVRIRMK